MVKDLSASRWMLYSQSEMDTHCCVFLAIISIPLAVYYGNVFKVQTKAFYGTVRPQDTTLLSPTRRLMQVCGILRCHRL